MGDASELTRCGCWLLVVCCSYRWNSAPLFSAKAVPGGIEDMFLWKDRRGGYHCLFHLMHVADTTGAPC